MPAFPIHVGSHSFDGPAALGAAVVADARAGGGTVLPNNSPSTWVGNLVRDKQLDAKLAVGLTAAMLQTTEAAVLCEASRLCSFLKKPQLGPLMALVLETIDVGLLLETDPFRASQSVEDTLLFGWHDVADLDDPDVRARVLAGFRNAGITDLEMKVLVRKGTPAEIRLWLPAIVEEGVPRGAAAAVAAALTRGDEVKWALLDTLKELPKSEKMPLWVAFQKDPELKGNATLMDQLFLRS